MRRWVAQSEHALALSLICVRITGVGRRAHHLWRTFSQYANALRSFRKTLKRRKQKEGRTMHTVIRSYTLVAGTREAFIKRVQERLVPLLNHVPGFRAFTLMEEGDNNVTFISTFHTLADAKASARITRDWHTEHLNV